MRTLSIGFTREDGDFQLLATLNNNDELVDERIFDSIVMELFHRICDEYIEHTIIILERQDAYDYIELDEEVSYA